MQVAFAVYQAVSQRDLLLSKPETYAMTAALRDDAEQRAREGGARVVALRQRIEILSPALKEAADGICGKVIQWQMMVHLPDACKNLERSFFDYMNVVLPRYRKLVQAELGIESLSE